MRQGSANASGAELKRLVTDTTQALALLDAERLEELARSCEALKREMEQDGPAERALRIHDAGEAARELAVLSRVLDATRANGRVLHRLMELRAGRREYGPSGDETTKRLTSCHGND